MWKTAKLDNVLKIQTGNSIPAKEKVSLYTNVADGLPYVATKDVGFDAVINYENGIRIPPEFSPKFRISKAYSTLICAEGGSAGRKIAFSQKDCHFVNKLFSLNPSKELIPKFIYYYALSSEFQDQFKKSMHGLIGGVSISKIKNFHISFPSLTEQQRIVAKLDNAFDEINKQINLNKQKKILEQNLRLSCLGKVFSLNVNKKEIGQIATVIAGQSPEGKYYNKNGEGVPFYQGKKDFGDYELKQPTVWTTKTTKISQKDDVLLSVRAPVGETNINKDKICIGRGLAAIRANEDNNFEFIYFFFNSIKNKLIGNTGAVFNSINKKQIEEILIPSLSIDEQTKIVDRIKLILSNLDNVNVSINKNLNNLNILKTAILNKELQSETA